MTPNGLASHSFADDGRTTPSREDDAGEKGPTFPCPEEVWIGQYREIADIVGVRDWRVWLGITAALSARAHRNAHASYYTDLYGMGYWLLVSGSSTGKSLSTRLCTALLPADYRKKYSIESGQGLLNLIADSVKNEAGKTTGLRPLPTILLLSEWSTLLSNMEIRGSSLLEKLMECYDSEHAVEVNRTEKMGQSDSLSVGEPMLTMIGSTTTEGFRKRVKERHKESGFINRHFILPGPTSEWKYPAQDQGYFPRRELEDYAAHALPIGHTFGHGQGINTLYDPVALALDEQWGRALFEPIHNATIEEDFSPYLRLHVYARRIAMLLAWSDGSASISPEHVLATHKTVETSYAFLRWLLDDSAIDLPAWQRVGTEIEEKIVRKIREKPGIRKDDVCKALRRNGGYTAIADYVDKLAKSGAILLKNEGQKKCLYLVS